MARPGTGASTTSSVINEMRPIRAGLDEFQAMDRLFEHGHHQNHSWILLSRPA
jgi:hypothetical protein